ncbi:MAG: ATP synthase F0 subunit B [Oscillospiraceae bacterium]|jgi:F-type H+-transporting ATPase subunit b|nr:ATP synthase F0 subunit B [Oscillospiraceae bacterium]
MNLFDFYIPEWIFVAVNLAVLVFILNRLLWKPVMKILAERQEKITAALAGAEAAREEARQFELQRAEHNLEFEKSTLEALKAARTRAGAEYDRIIVEAEDKARTIVSAAQSQAQREHESMLIAARTEIVTAAEDLASSLLGENLDESKNSRIIRRFLERGETGAME